MVQRRAITLADRVTLVRLALVLWVALLAWERLRVGTTNTTDTRLLVSLSVLALVLDGVDGWVARRTGGATDHGARFDMEVDAALILVLSAYVAADVGVWVLAIGLARYVYALLMLVLPWLGGSVPPTQWRKVVAVVQGVALTVAAAGVLPGTLMTAVLLVALGLLAVSFGTQVWWLWRHRTPGPVVSPRAATGLAVVLVWVALVVPDDLDRLSGMALLRLPIEGLLLLVVATVLPDRPRTVLATSIGFLLGVLLVSALLDLGFTEALGRPFDPVQDWGYAGSAFGLVRSATGPVTATAVSVVLFLLVIGLLAGLPWAVRRITRLAHENRHRLGRALPAALALWLLAALLGLQSAPGVPVASANAVSVARDQLDQVRSGLADRRDFGAAARSDAFADTPGSHLLTGLRGKDVLLVFVESYGRVALQGAEADQVTPVLDAGTKELRAAGFDARSAYLTSPTFGGISWLAHSTLQSGLWVDSQGRYDDLLTSDRFTLSAAFQRAGWRTVDVVPSNTEAWSQGMAFYHYDRVYGSSDLGYAGPSFSYATMPDQYVLAALQRLELAPTHRAPVMAEVDLVSSHTPWAPLPSMVSWSAVGDGSVFDGMPEQGASPEQVWPDPGHVRTAYAQSIAYTLHTLVSFVRTYGDDSTVLVVLGDHQPATIVSGTGASHDVPVAVIAHDPRVLARISSWGWSPGLRPEVDAPIWRMDAFRDQFLSTFGPQPH